MYKTEDNVIDDPRRHKFSETIQSCQCCVTTVIDCIMSKVTLCTILYM